MSIRRHDPLAAFRPSADAADACCEPGWEVQSRREAKRGDEVETGCERAAERREAKLEMVRQQVERGSLVIRQMTDEDAAAMRPALCSPSESASGEHARA